MTAQHTPEPWRAIKLADGSGRWRVIAGIIDREEPGYGGPDTIVIATYKGPHAERNARLIAAAPLMLDALRYAHSFIAEHYEWWTDGTDEYTTEVDIFESITAAIAAATGEDA